MNSTHRIIIAQGPASTVHLLEKYGHEASGHTWVAYDVRAQEFLKEKNVPFLDFDGIADASELEAIDARAHVLSQRWYRDAGAFSLVARQELFVESLFAKDFNYLFLGLLRAYHLLERLRTRFGAGVEITLAECKEGSASPVRMSDEESFLPALLLNFASEWGWSVRLEKFSHPAPAKCRQAADWPGGWLRTLTFSKRAETVYGGNPLLLAPVAARGAGRALRLRWINSNRQYLLALKKDLLPFKGARGGVRPYELEPKRLREALKSGRTFDVKGVSLLFAVAPYLERFYSEVAPVYRLDFESMRRLLRRVRARHVIVDEDVTDRNGLLVLAAKAENLRTMVVLHGTPIKPLGFVPVKAERIAVWGERDRDVLSGWGVDDSMIRITGCPKYDRLSTEKNTFNRSAFFKEQSLDASKPVVLVAPANFPRNGLERFESLASNPFEYVRYLEIFSRAARETPGVQFIFKYHAGAFDEGLVSRALRRAGNRSLNVRVVKSGGAVPYLLASDVVFCGYSSLIHEAIYLDRVVAMTNFSKYPHPFMLDEGEMLTVTSPEEALAVCKRLESGCFDREGALKKQERLVKMLFYSKDGGASRRAAEFAFQS